MKKAFLLQQTHCSEQKSELLSETDLVWGHGFLALIWGFIYLFSAIIFWINHSLCLHGGKTFFCSLCMANNLLFLPYLIMFLLFTPHLLSRRWTTSQKSAENELVIHLAQQQITRSNCKKQVSTAAAQGPWSCIFALTLNNVQKLHQFLPLLKPHNIFIPDVDTYPLLQTKNPFEYYCLQFLTVCHGFMRSLVSVGQRGLGWDRWMSMEL